MTKHPRHGFLAVIAALVLALPLLSFALPRQMEAINRGLVVSNVGKSGMLVSWRLLGTERSDTQFNLYRDGKKIATIGKTAGTNFLDKDGKVTSKYTVAAVVDSVEGRQESASVVFDSTVAYGGMSFPYKVLKVEPPADQVMPDSAKTVCSYVPNDMSAADLDGDGEYELILKWEPTNSKDNSQSMDGAYTGSVFIDAYKLSGKKLWRVSLGKNIRAGAHYTQFQVFDYDGDGKAEMIVKTADGSVDGKGKVIGDSSKDYRNTKGTILDGPEYLTVFRGIDGAEITTVDYLPPRSIQKMQRDTTGKGDGWGDNYGNRADRFLAATAYLDGVHPSAIFARGYYTASYVVAYDFDGKNLKQRWFHKSETPGKGLYEQGNHNIFVGDINGDGSDEIVYGGAALNSDGTVLYTTGLGHGDAGHLGDLDPDRPGLEYFGVHEYGRVAKYMDELRDAKGNIVFGTPQPDSNGVDNGRGMAADIDSTYRGYEFWSSKSRLVRTVKGAVVDTATYVGGDTSDYDHGIKVYPMSFRIYFDADLQDELLDGQYMYKYLSKEKTIKTYFDGEATLGLIGNQGTKNFPCLVADILGDWREELILRSEEDPSKVYILSTPVTTPYRVYTLMHDAVYRMAIAWQNTAYNQPPHLGYYLPDMVKKLAKPDLYTVGDSAYTVYPDAVITKSSGNEKQTVTVDSAISDIAYSFIFCTGIKADGLPDGVSAKVDSAAKTVKISGKPSKAGTFAFTLTTTGSKAGNATAKGEIVVKAAEVKPDTSKTDTTKTDTTKTDTSKVVTSESSIVDAAYPDEGEGSTENEDAGFIGRGYFDFKNSKSSYGTWLIKSAKASSTTMSVRYANGDTVSRDMILVVNDEEIGTVKMGETGGWSAWNTFDIDIKLKKGKNTITLKSTSKKGGADVDAFLFDIVGVESYTDKKSDALPVARLNSGFFYRPATGALFTSVPGFAEVQFYDISGTMRGSVSGYVQAGESVLALERGVLAAGMYIVKVKLNGVLKQKGMYKQ